MATKRKYAYYIKGNKIAIIEAGQGSGVCSLSGYNTQSACEDAGGTWTQNASGLDDGEYRSPIQSITGGLEIQYAYSPIFHLPDVTGWSDANANVTKMYYNAWTSVDGYLTLLRSSTTWSAFSKFDVDDTIFINGSSRWNGLHKIQEIQSDGDVTHGGIKTYTKVGENIPSIVDSSVTWTTSGTGDETITSMGVLIMEAAFTDSDTTPYIWIMGSNETVNNNGLFSGWSSATNVLTLSGGKRYDFSSDLTIADEDIVGTDVQFSADSSENIYIYKAFRERDAYMITDVSLLSDETFELDLTRYQANAVVYYLKAKLAEDAGDVEQREFFLREFKRQLEKGVSALKRGPYIVQGFKEMR